MQKSNKKLAGKIAALVLMLTVISCCFVGSTFAKYTSSKTASATVTAARWEVTGVSENTEAQEFEMTAKLSPNHEDAAEGSSAKNTVSATYTITNNSDVAAKITWTLPENGYTINAVENATYYGQNVAKTATGFTSTQNGADVTLLTDDQVKSTITFKVSAAKGETAIAESTSEVELAAKPASGTAESVTITVTATWTTSTDAIDTAIGMYVESITQNLTVTATQASTVPAPTPAA